MVLSEGVVAPVDYDSARVASLRRADGQLVFPQTLTWLERRQRADGTWGSSRFHAHDRLVSTLAAVLCLGEAGVAPGAVERGLAAVPGLIARLGGEEQETIGFEVIAPRLLDLCSAAGLAVPDALAPERRRRTERLAAGARGTVLFSLEGIDRVPRELGRFLGPTGGLFSSPSATAAYLTAHPDEPRAWAYLEALAAQGGVTALSPVDFVGFWTCWQMDLAGQGHLPLAQALREQAARTWTNQGATWVTGFPVPDSDDTALSLLIQLVNGRCPDPGVSIFAPYMTPRGVIGFLGEYDPSISANVHVLMALRAAPPSPQTDEWASFLLHVLNREIDRRPDHMLLDKWHIGATYTTGHAALATRGIDDRLCERLGEALVAAQNPDGTWGAEGGSAEEVAYAVYALCLTHPQRYREIIRTGRQALERLAREPAPALWIGKSLYLPGPIVDSAIEAARVLSDRALGQA